MGFSLTVAPVIDLVTDRPEEVARAIERAGSWVAASAGIRIVEKLREVTPKDTGLAAASWIASVGLPTSLEGGDKTNVSYENQNRSIERLKTFSFSQGAIFIGNRQKYIRKLNDGSSTKEPAGFVERACNDVSVEVGIVTVKL